MNVVCVQDRKSIDHRVSNARTGRIGCTGTSVPQGHRERSALKLRQWTNRYRPPNGTTIWNVPRSVGCVSCYCYVIAGYQFLWRISFWIYRSRNDVEQVVEVSSRRQTAQGAVRVVTRNSVISSALEVQRDQIHSVWFPRLLEQMVRQLSLNKCIKTIELITISTHIIDWYKDGCTSSVT